MAHGRVYDIMQNVVDSEEWRRRSATSNHAPRQFDEWGEKPGERDSHKAVPIAVTPHRLIVAEVPFELAPLQTKCQCLLQQKCRILLKPEPHHRGQTPLKPDIILVCIYFKSAAAM